MRLSRALITLAVGFLLGVLVESAIGFSGWFLLVAIVIAVSVGAVDLTAGSRRGFLVFLFLLSLMLGLVRSATYREDFSKDEKTFWQGTRGFLVSKFDKNFPKASGARPDIQTPRKKNKINKAIRNIAPKNPNSSAATAKIESPIGSGR